MSDDGPPSFPFRSDGPLQPPVEFARLRLSEPVTRVTLPSGDIAWLVTRHDGVRTVLTDPRFSHQLHRPDVARLTAGGGVNEFERNPIAAQLSDPPGHTRWRALVAPALRPARVEGLRARARAIAAELIADGVHHGPPLELMSCLVFPLPLRVICELFGVPPVDHMVFGKRAEALNAPWRHTKEEIAAARSEMGAYMRSLIAAKRDAMGDDFTSDLIAAHDEENGRLSDEELLYTLQAMLVAGWQTTANQLGKMLLFLFANPELLATVRRDRAFIASTVEEALRFIGGIAGFGLARYATEAVEVSGTDVPKGATVLAQLGSANRDERQFVDPDRFDCRRDPIRHFTFGGGPHFCPGAGLARMQLQVALEAVLDVPGARLAIDESEVRMNPGLFVQRPDALPVTW